MIFGGNLSLNFTLTQKPFNYTKPAKLRELEAPDPAERRYTSVRFCGFCKMLVSLNGLYIYGTFLYSAECSCSFECTRGDDSAQDLTRKDVLSESNLRKVIVRPVLNDFFMFSKLEMECWTVMEIISIGLIWDLFPTSSHLQNAHFFFLHSLISLKADGPHHYHPACGH